MPCCPYPLLVLPLLLAVAAMVLTWYGTFQCNFFETLEQVSVHNTTAVQRGYGLWLVRDGATFFAGTSSFTVSETCLAYGASSFTSTDKIDTPITVARVFSLVTSAASIGTVIVLLLASCVRFGDGSFQTIMTCIFVLFGMLTLLTLIVLTSDICQLATSCQLKDAGYTMVGAGIAWFLTACFTLCLRQSDNNNAGEEDHAAAAAAAATGSVNSPKVEEGPANDEGGKGYACVY